VQKMLRHTDAQVTTERYAHLVPGYLQEQITRLKLISFASPLLPPAANDKGPTDPAGPNTQELLEVGLERETGIEPATLSLGMRSDDSAGHGGGWQPVERPALGDRERTVALPGFATFCTREAPIEPQKIALDARDAEDGHTARQRARRCPQVVSGVVAWLSVSDVAKQLRVSSATVYRLIHRGELRHARASNAIRISPADLATFVRGGS